MFNRQMLKQAQQLQAQLAKIQEELEIETVAAAAGGEAVTVVATGKQRIQSITIKPDVVDPEDVEMLQDLVLTAVNDGLDKAQEVASSRMNALTGGMKIPGLM